MISCFKTKILILLMLVNGFLCYSQEITLKTLIFYDDFSRKIFNVYNGVYLLDIDVPDPSIFEEEMEHFLDRTMNKKLVDEICEKILDYYHERGRSVVRVVIPAGQDFSNGELRIIIVGGRLGSIDVIEDQHSSEQKEKLTKILKNIREEENEVLLLEIE